MNRQIPINISGTDALNSIGENIIISDRDYNITWMNSKATKSLSAIAPLYGLKNADDLIGLKMDFFHKKPNYQRRVMAELEDGHRARINIQGKFDADIVVTPIKGNENPEQIEGYMVMLMDVTTQAEEEKKKEKLIQDLSVPILKIWDKTIALTLVGELDLQRGETVIATVLEECVTKGIEYVVISLIGINSFDDSVRQNLQKLYDSLKLIGVECIIVGIKPKLAMNIRELSNILTFSDANAALKYIIGLQYKKSAKKN
ncbi:STAS domain-containing protein [Bacillus solitudinis]|uniref:STAS domain-containing protein n=1 Tax=Bacillus solitudinis TaxID=2014074 RepID=UPI000C23AB78|nr:STAS domain-containing protein [Bacillus solitudinis]